MLFTNLHLYCLSICQLYTGDVYNNRVGDSYFKAYCNLKMTLKNLALEFVVLPVGQIQRRAFSFIILSNRYRSGFYFVGPDLGPNCLQPLASKEIFNIKLLILLVLLFTNIQSMRQDYIMLSKVRDDVCYMCTMLWHITMINIQGQVIISYSCM